MSAPPKPTGCPKCGRPDLRTLTWRELGIQETTLGCWDCDWVTFPAGVTADNWQERMRAHKETFKFVEKRIRELLKRTDLSPEASVLLKMSLESITAGKIPEIPMRKDGRAISISGMAGIRSCVHRDATCQ